MCSKLKQQQNTTPLPRPLGKKSLIPEWWVIDTHSHCADGAHLGATVPARPLRKRENAGLGNWDKVSWILLLSHHLMTTLKQTQSRWQTASFSPGPCCWMLIFLTDGFVLLQFIASDLIKTSNHHPTHLNSKFYTFQGQNHRCSPVFKFSFEIGLLCNSVLPWTHKCVPCPRGLPPAPQCPGITSR